MTKRHAGTVPEHFSKTCSSIISGVISFFYADFGDSVSAGL